MSFKLKTLLAALALTAVTAPAQAAFTNISSGGSSFLLTTIDNAGSISALYDLGFNHSEFSNIVSQANANGGTYTWDLTQGNYGTAWNTFFATAQAPRTQWAVIAASYTDGAASNLISTYSSGTSRFASITDKQISLTNFNNYLIASASLGNHASATDGANIALTANGAAYAGTANAYGAATSGRINGRGYDTTGALGSVLTLRQFTGDSSIDPNAAVVESTMRNALGNYTMSLSSAGILTFTSPVPEADSNAMLMVGLGMIGFMVRRRKA